MTAGSDSGRGARLRESRAAAAVAAAATAAAAAAANLEGEAADDAAALARELVAAVAHGEQVAMLEVPAQRRHLASRTREKARS